MSIVTIREKIHHGNYLHIRVGILPAFDAGALDHFMAESTYGSIKADQVAQTLDDLTKAGRAELGWSTYTVRELPDDAGCEYYALCENAAVGVVSVRPIHHPVPTCQRCADKHDLEVVKFLQAGPEPTKLEPKFTVVREANGDAVMIDTYELPKVDTPERKLWAVQDIEKSCEHDMIDTGCEECIQPLRVLPGVHVHSDIIYYLVTEEEWTDDDKDTEYVL